VLEKIALVILGVLLSGIGYWIKRFVERKGDAETLERHKKLLEINKQMTEQQVTVEDLKRLESALTGKTEAIAAYSRTIESEATPLLEVNHDEPITQAEMNTVASNNFESAKQQMTAVLSELLSLLDGEEKAALSESQRAWESYCLEQAEAAAISYHGGSIYPVIFFSEMESLTVERAARLQVELDHLRRTRGESPNPPFQGTRRQAARP